MALKEFGVSTSEKSEMIDITSKVQDVVDQTGISNGLCMVYAPHTTAAITINEGADPAVVRDIINKLGDMVPWRDDYQHREGNSAAHIKSTLVGNSANAAIRNGHINLGTWQKIFFCEFDGPRSRKVQVSVVEE